MTHNNSHVSAEQLNTEQASFLEARSKDQFENIIRFDNEATRFIIPSKYSNFSVVELGHITCPYKKLIFSALNAAHFLVFSNNDFSEGKRHCFSFVKEFWLFVCETDFDTKNKTKVLKAFETYRVECCGVKPQSSGLKGIARLFEIALQFKDFHQNLNGWQIEYLHLLRKTKAAKEYEKEPINLAAWLSWHSWLRRDDIGIGHNLYKRLESPKALMLSFRVTVETALSQIQLAKDALIEFFQTNNLKISDFPCPKNIEPTSTPNEAQAILGRDVRQFLQFFSENIPPRSKIDLPLLSAFELVIYSNVLEQYRNEARQILIDKKDSPFISGQYITSLHPIFHVSFVRELLKYSEDTSGAFKPRPVCRAEQILFSWLMAYQTVQKSDIFKLKLSDFSFATKINGSVSVIECKYFKGRANSVHYLKTISASTDLGKVLLKYIRDRTALENKSINLVSNQGESYVFSKTGVIPRILMLFDISSFNIELQKKLQREKITPVFIEAFKALFRNGKSLRRMALRNTPNYEAACKNTFFNHTHIKTSAVYAQSDFFDPSTLLNYNSHTDKTEECEYRVEHNKEWLNTCGKVTRAVMRDLNVNVFRSSKRDRQLFESEYTLACEVIDARKNEVLNSMVLITGQEKGQVDDLGFYKNKSPLEGDLPDSIYLQDSPFTVTKLLHYLQQVKELYPKLLDCSPSYLFNTILPTTEWIEQLLDNKMFSERSLMDGRKMYRDVKAELPPLFAAFIE